MAALDNWQQQWAGRPWGPEGHSEPGPVFEHGGWRSVAVLSIVPPKPCPTIKAPGSWWGGVHTAPGSHGQGCACVHMCAHAVLSSPTSGSHRVGAVHMHLCVYACMCVGAAFSCSASLLGAAKGVLHVCTCPVPDFCKIIMVTLTINNHWPHISTTPVY